MKTKQRIEVSNFFRSFEVELDEVKSAELIAALKAGESFDLLFPDFEDEVEDEPNAQV